MIKLRTTIILFLLYLLSFLSIRYDLNLLYPYYYLKDLILYPVNAITKDENISLSDDTLESLIAALKKDNDDLKKMLDLNISLSDYQRINATVISRNKEYWFNTITINKGKKDGITIDASVLGSNGLIGRISNVRELTSDVKLLTTNDENNKISIVVHKDNKDYYGIMSGYDKKMNLLKVIMFDDVDLLDNLKVETTGLGGVFPKGILIGYVFDTYKDNDDVTNIIRVRPSSNLEGESYVSVFQRKVSS